MILNGSRYRIFWKRFYQNYYKMFRLSFVIKCCSRMMVSHFKVVVCSYLDAILRGDGMIVVDQSDGNLDRQFSKNWLHLMRATEGHHSWDSSWLRIEDLVVRLSIVAASFYEIPTTFGTVRQSFFDAIKHVIMMWSRFWAFIVNITKLNK